MAGLAARLSVQGISDWGAPERAASANVMNLAAAENPYPPPQTVINAINTTTARIARIHPDPDSTDLRMAIAEKLQIAPQQVLVGPGSISLQRLIAQTFVDPEEPVGYLWPSAKHFESIARLVGAEPIPIEYTSRTQEEALLAAPRNLRLLFLCSPNVPFGRGIDTNTIEEYATQNPGTLIVIDEAYEAFRGKSAIRLVRQGYPNIVLMRSFSKSHALAGMRVGYAIGTSSTISAMDRARPPFEVSAVSQAAALAAWKANDWFNQTMEKISATRDRFRVDAMARGFEVRESEANFLYMRCGDAFRIYRALKERNILVRVFDEYDLRDGIRVTIGTDEQMDLLTSSFDHMMHFIPQRRNTSSSADVKRAVDSPSSDAIPTVAKSAAAQPDLDDELDLH